MRELVCSYPLPSLPPRRATPRGLDESRMEFDSDEAKNVAATAVLRGAVPSEDDRSVGVGGCPFVDDATLARTRL